MMKKIFTLIALFATTCVAMAQTLNVYEWKNGMVNVRSASDIDSVTFSLPETPVVLTTEKVEATSNSIVVTFMVTTSINFNSIEVASEQGVCYSTTEELPTYDDNTAKFGTFSTGSCSVTISDVTPSTTYYCRPYAKIGNEIYYASGSTQVNTQEESVSSPSLVGRWVLVEWGSGIGMDEMEEELGEKITLELEFSADGVYSGFINGEKIGESTYSFNEDTGMLFMSEGGESDLEYTKINFINKDKFKMYAADEYGKYDSEEFSQTFERVK